MAAAVVRGRRGAQVSKRGGGMGKIAGATAGFAVAAVLVLAALPALAGDDLTPLEARWLERAGPVLGDALRQGLPLDIVVQPESRPGDAPLALGYVDGRCKLVLSMRGNPAAAAALDGITPELLAPVVEAMTAHEMGHCWRYVRGAWHTVPAGFVAAASIEAGDDAQHAGLRREMRETRREEGYADLVGLAWTAERHPAQYAAVHAWLWQLRDREPLAGSHHDTRAWLRLAQEPRVFAAGAARFEQAQGVWQRGLEDDAR
jgi:hypothetical protein